MSNKRKKPEARKSEILQAAVDLAIKTNYNTMTRDGIADHADVSMGLVTHYFETMNQLKRAVMRYAIANNIPTIIAQGIANKDDHAIKAPDALKQQALVLIANY